MHPRFPCCENYVPQFLSFTVGAVALPLASVCALVGQFWSALEFIPPGVMVGLLVAPGSSQIPGRRHPVVPALAQCFWRSLLKKQLPQPIEWCFNAAIHRGAPYGRG
ncbi:MULTISPECIES: hypothetical protein [unclassified Mesorhizobium]|uniref:hypothetical protein n=1 Tax=unclassified Mesorhizobium TaxID=325217 RepID=UPI0016747876|nr:MULTISPECIES: hypothetical protein [unclassified Mesorhizobium]